jgi:hypothetical protein
MSSDDALREFNADVDELAAKLNISRLEAAERLLVAHSYRLSCQLFDYGQSWVRLQRVKEFRQFAAIPLQQF